jgi:hypothetical protein
VCCDDSDSVTDWLSDTYTSSNIDKNSLSL